MKRIRWIIAAVALASACKGKGKDAADPNPPPAASCATQTAELKPWIEGLVGGKPTTAPWPTGDQAFDAELPALRDEARALRKPADPAAPVAPLVSGVTPGRLDAELATCDAAKAQVQKISAAPPDQATASWAGLADAIAACDCKPSIPRVKALLYLAQRGPD